MIKFSYDKEFQMQGNREPNRIHQIIKGQRRITADTDLRLTTYFGLSQGYFLRYQEDYELRIAKREIENDIKRIQPIQLSM